MDGDGVGARWHDVGSIAMREPFQALYNSSVHSEYSVFRVPQWGNTYITSRTGIGSSVSLKYASRYSR